MPIIRADSLLIFYAHVPKCGGSAVERYLAARFGPVAFSDHRYMTQPVERRWSRTSPQHVARADLRRMFPEGFFDYTFSIVRHPVARAVSAYHFQLEREGSIPESTSFSEWVDLLPELLETDAFAYDNHIRPMDDFVPPGSEVFHMEHGLDGIVPWFDSVTGRATGPRALPIVNEQSARGTTRVKPDDRDVERLAEIYAVDFDRFGYQPDTAGPNVAAPPLPPETVAAREAERARAGHPFNRLRSTLRRTLGR